MNQLNHESYDLGVHGNMINQPNNNCLGLCYTVGGGTSPQDPCITIGISVNPSRSNPNPGANVNCSWTF